MPTYNSVPIKQSYKQARKLLHKNMPEKYALFFPNGINYGTICSTHKWMV